MTADLMASCGAETIIAVDVGAEDNNDLTNYGDQVSGWSLLWNRLNPFAKKLRVNEPGRSCPGFFFPSSVAANTSLTVSRFLAARFLPSPKSSPVWLTSLACDS